MCLTEIFLGLICRVGVEGLEKLGLYCVEVWKHVTLEAWVADNTY